MAAQTKRWVSKQLALTLSLLVLGATSGDLGHALAGGTGHGFETTIATANGEPADENSPSPASSHVATQCQRCRVGHASSTALSRRIAWLTAVGDFNTDGYITACVPANVVENQEWHFTVDIVDVGQTDPRGRVE